MKTELLKETTIYVSDLEVSESFYTNIVGLVVAERVKDQYALFQYDDGTLILFQTPTTSIENEGTSSGLNKLGQLSFGISSADISTWRKRLQNYDVSIEEEVAWPNGAQSIYFRDPAGNRIELKSQKRRSQDMAKEEQIRKVSPGGLDAKWKIYHAVNQGKNLDTADFL